MANEYQSAYVRFIRSLHQYSLVDRRIKWEQLNAPFEGKFWKGQDVVVPHTTIIGRQRDLDPQSALQFMHIAYNSQSFPSFDWFTQEHAALLQTSLRSRLGQGALHLDEVWASDEVFGDFDSVKNSIALGNTKIHRVVIGNYGAREIILPEGFGVFRFIYPWAAERLMGNKLEEVVLNDEIEIGGSEGKEWDFIRVKDRIVGLNLAVRPDSWKYHPHKSDLPTLEFKEGVNYRQQIDDIILSPEDSAPDPDEKVLWVCESQSPLTINNANINGSVADMVEVRRIDERSSFFVPHTNALLIEGGRDSNGHLRTNWNIRFEILAPMNERPSQVRVDFYRDR